MFIDYKKIRTLLQNNQKIKFKKHKIQTMYKCQCFQ